MEFFVSDRDKGKQTEMRCAVSLLGGEEEGGAGDRERETVGRKFGRETRRLFRTRSEYSKSKIENTAGFLEEGGGGNQVKDLNISIFGEQIPSTFSGQRAIILSSNQSTRLCVP